MVCLFVPVPDTPLTKSIVYLEEFDKTTANPPRRGEEDEGAALVEEEIGGY